MFEDDLNELEDGIVEEFDNPEEDEDGIGGPKTEDSDNEESDPKITELEPNGY